MLPNLPPAVRYALEQKPGSGRKCQSCFFELPSYPGKYPSLCPACGASVMTKAEAINYITNEGYLNLIKDK